MERLVVSNRFQMSFIDYPSINKSAIVYYVYGCDFKCPGCQNAELQIKENPDLSKVNIFETPEKFLEYIVKNDIKSNKNNGLVVFQGGDPLNRRNREFILNTIRLSVEKNTGLKFCIYTGFPIEGVATIFNPEIFGITHGNNRDVRDLHKMVDILDSIPYIKCGEYVKDKPNSKVGKVDGKLYLATTNQIFYKYNREKRGYEPISINGITDLALVD